jgi:transposase InsO family protein
MGNVKALTVAFGKEAQVVIEAWRDHYNQERPHSALNYLSPRNFIQHWHQQQALLRQSA